MPGSTEWFPDYYFDYYFVVLDLQTFFKVMIAYFIRQWTSKYNQNIVLML